MREKKPDIVHTHGVEGFSPILWHTARSLGIPLVHTAHDYYMICPRALLLTRRLALCSRPSLACRARSAWYLRRAAAIDLFCSPSQFLLDRHLVAGLPVKRHAVVPNGIPTVPRAARPAARDPARPLELLFAGRLTAEKGVHVAIEAMKRLPGDAGVRLTIAGKGYLEGEVRAAAAANPRISFAGYLSGEEKIRVFSAADCLLLPSLWYENAPVVVLEAAAYQLPVIGSRLGAIPEFVQDSVTGLLFEAGSAQSLADTILRVASNDALRAALATGGSPLIAKHSIPGMLDRYAAHYADLTDGAARADATQASGIETTR